MTKDHVAGQDNMRGTIYRGVWEQRSLLQLYILGI